MNTKAEEPITMVLRVVSELGAATLESIIIWLDPQTAAIDTARAFQTARERAWVEEDARGHAARGNPAYRLTQFGSNELARTVIRSVGDIRAAGANADSDVPIETVLRVLTEFEQSGGASVQLIAWELDVDQSRVIAAWTKAIDDGLIERCGSDTVDGREEEMWILTEAGHRARVAERVGVRA
jgi:hypothetical protein